MTNEAEKIIEPTAEERAYSQGWNAYYSNAGINVNPFDPETETSLYESFEDGWSTAQRGEFKTSEEE